MRCPRKYIPSFHWAWIWLPASIYVWVLSSSVARLLVLFCTEMTSENSGDTRSIGWMLLYLLVIIPLAVFAYAVVLMYRILSGEVMAKEALTLRIPAFVGVYICGLGLGMVADWLCVSVFILF